MRRVSLLFLAVVLLLTACTASPKQRADEFEELLPATIGNWEQDDGETVKLLSNTVTNKGHVAFTYEGPDDAIAFIVVEAHPSEDAAEVAVASRMRELMLAGVEFSTDRKARYATADVAETDRIRYAFFQEADLVVEIDALAAEDAPLVSEEDFVALLDIVREVLLRLEVD